MKKSIAATLGIVALVAASGVLLMGTSFAAPMPDDLVIDPGAQVLTDSEDADQKFGDKRDTDAGNEDAGDKDAVAPAVYNLGLHARRFDNSMITRLFGPRLSLCSVHGPGAIVDFATEGGNSPFSQVGCGRGFGLDVSLTSCAASLEYHGYVHSDRSGEIYLGMMTADVHFEKTGPQDGHIRMTIYTPKKAIVVSGTVHSPTPIVMTTCAIP